MQTTEEILEVTLSTVPAEIRDIEFKMLGFSNNVSAMSTEMKKIESSKMANIVGATVKVEGVEKKAFTNNIAREAELHKHLSRDKDYKEAKESKKASQKELKKEEINLRFLKNKLQSARYLTMLFTNGGNKSE